MILEREPENSKNIIDSLPETTVIPTMKENIEEIKFNIDSLNDSNFKRMINYFDSFSTSPIEYILTSQLASLSGAIGKYPFIEITKSLNIYLNVWAVLIGPSTIMKKTTAINNSIDELNRIAKREYKLYIDNYNQYQSELAAAKEKKNKLFNKPLPLRDYYLFPNDSTIESLSDILSYSKRGLLVHSEFGSLLSQLNRGYSGDSKQFLTTIYDVPETWEVSRATKENILLQRPFISILGASTIDWVKENSNPSDLRSGFLARFLYSIRNRPDKRFMPLLRLRELTKQSENYIDVREIYEYLISFREPAKLEITNKAVDLHCEYDEQSYYEMLNLSNENEASFKARLLIYALKFAGIIAITDRRNQITFNDMKDALNITNYFKRNVERLLNNEMTQTEFIRSENKIIDILKSNGGKVQHSNLLQLSNMKARELTEVIRNLEEKEKIITVFERSRNNKSTKYYKVNSTVK